MIFSFRDQAALEITGYLPVSVPAPMVALEVSLGGVRLGEQRMRDRSDE